MSPLRRVIIGAHCAFAGVRPTDGAGGFFWHPVQLPKIAIIEEPADHVRRDLRGADRVELLPGRELKPAIGGRQLRESLGYRPDERVCIVTVGGSGVGGHLIRQILESFPMVHTGLPDLRMVVLTGPRIDPQSLNAPAEVEMRAFVPNLDLSHDCTESIHCSCSRREIR